MARRAQQYRATAAAALPAFAAGQPQENIYLQASDGAVSHGILYRPVDAPNAKVCIYLMHPRGPMSRHYLAGHMPVRTDDLSANHRAMPLTVGRAEQHPNLKAEHRQQLLAHSAGDAFGER